MLYKLVLISRQIGLLTPHGTVLSPQTDCNCTSFNVQSCQWSYSTARCTGLLLLVMTARTEQIIMLTC